MKPLFPDCEIRPVRGNLQTRLGKLDNGEYDALVLAFSRKPSLLLLDLVLPDLPGEEVCRRLRAHAPTADIPVIMLTVKDSETDKVIGFETGADDYVTKPFSEQILLARIRALLRRHDMAR